MPDESQAEVILPGSYAIAGGLRDVIGSLPGIAQVEEI
jgi:DNA polymerase-3 subunit alpha